MRRVTGLVALLLVAVACSQQQPTFSLTSATVDASYWCPGGATDAKYDVHAVVHVRNSTSRNVTIQSATANMVLASVTGRWLEPIGERYDAGSVTFKPATVAANSSATLDVTIPSSCTSGSYGSTLSSSGSYRVTVRLVTSAGAYAIVAGNRHEILAA